MAIAYDNSLAVANWSASNPATASFAIAGSNRGMLLHVFANSSQTGCTVTYNGVSMTAQHAASVDIEGNKHWLFKLAAPSTGTNTISISRTGGANMSSTTISFTGVDQTNIVDASAFEDGQTASGSYTSNSVTVGSADNWLVTFVRNTDNSTITSGTVTKRINSSTVISEGYDSNGTVAAGSTSVSYTLSPSARLSGHYLVSLAAGVSDIVISPSAQVLTASIPAYGVSAGAVLGVNTQVVTGSLPAPTVSGAALVSVNAQVATFDIPAYTIISAGVSIAANVQSLTLSVPTYAVLSGATLSANTQTLTFSLPAETVTGAAQVNVSPVVLTLTIPTLEFVGALWRRTARTTTGADWTRSPINND